MSRQGSRVSRVSQYRDDDGADGSPRSGDGGGDSPLGRATELRDSTAGGSESTSAGAAGDGAQLLGRASGAAARHNDDQNNSADGGAGTSAVVSSDAAPHDDELTWTDRDGTQYHYYENPLISVCPFILVQELCERLAYYGISPTLKPFLKRTLDLDDAGASAKIGLFQGLLYLTPIVSAALADSFLGVYRTIVVFSVVYCTGLVLLDVSAIDAVTEKWMVVLALFVLVTVGAGGIKSCVNVFGGQQFHPQHPRHAAATTSFFSYFYAVINLGSLVGGITVPQLAESVSFFVAYLVPVCSFVVASVVFVCGSSRYVYFKPKGSPVIDVARVLFAATRNCCNFQACKRSKGGDFDDAFVDDVLQLLRLMPILSLTLPLNIAYNQMTTAFLTQGEKMDSRIFGAHFAPALMQNVDPAAVVLASLIVDRLLFPTLRSRGWMPSVISRFTIGCVLGGIALMCAVGVERAVMAQEVPNTVSIWWQVPQFTLIGVAEIFTFSTSYEVAYTMAPQKLKAVASACNLLYFSLSGFLSSLLFTVSSGWMPNFKVTDPATYKDAHYDYYFVVLAGICGAGVLASFALRSYFFGVIKRENVLAEEQALLDGC